jgi:hypothetical protein
MDQVWGPGLLWPYVVTTTVWETEEESLALFESERIIIPFEYARAPVIVAVTAMTRTGPPGVICIVGWMRGEDVAAYPVVPEGHVVPLRELESPQTCPRVPAASDLN